MPAAPNTFAESLAAVLAHCRPLEGEEVSSLEAAGRVLAEDVVVTTDDPPHPKSAMDGFALRAADTAGASGGAPVTLAFDEVVGAGHLAAGEVTAGRAVRLMTGGWLPAGADAVVKQEDTRSTGEGRFTLAAPLRPGENVIPAGARLKRGERPLAAGDVVTPEGLGVVTGLGLDRLRVHRRPRVALLACGDELVEVGRPLAPGQLHVSNLYVLEAKVAHYGGVPVRLGIAPDDPEAMLEALRPHLPGGEAAGDAPPCDLVCTLGGSHGGDFDFAHHVLERLGAAIHFRRTRVNLGGSTIFATAGATVLFGLPGTPVPSLGAFELLVRPALWRLAGRNRLERPLLRARLTAPLTAWPDATCFQPARVDVTEQGDITATPHGRGAGADAPDGSLANGLIHVPPATERLDAGATVKVEWFEP